MNLNEWIAHIDNLRKTDVLLARGRWTGYISDPHASSPLRGRHVLVRWKNSHDDAGSIVIAHDDTEQVIKLAHTIESAI